MSLKPKVVDFDEIWKVLRATMRDVINIDKVNRSDWNDRFSDVYALCVASPDPFTKKLYDYAETFINEHVKDLLKEIQGAEKSTLLQKYYESWNKYSQGINYLNKLYSYLNMQQTKKGKMTEADALYGDCFDEPKDRHLEIGELGLVIWKNEMLEPLKFTIVELVLQAIREDRQGSASIPTSIVNGVISSFVIVDDLSLKNKAILSTDSPNQNFYELAFEKRFIEDTSLYFQQEANQLIATCSVSEYMDKVIHKLNEEDMRARRYLSSSSYSKVESECHKCFVTDHLSMLHSDCSKMVENDLRKELADMFCLLKPLPTALQFLAETFESHIKKVGLASLSNFRPETAHMDFVESAMGVYRKYKGIVNTVFKSDQLFISSLDKALATIINFKVPNARGPCKSPDYLAKYCDTLLKKSMKGLTEAEVDEKLSESIIIFKYIEDKDVYQKNYSRNLAKRLIHQLSQSMDLEEGMINRLKNACGYEFTSKLHRMFTDVSLSGDLSSKFSKYLDTENIALGVSFNMLVIQAGAWPCQQSSSSFAIPQVLEKAVQSFETFYGRQYSGRKLTWLHHLSSAEVKLSHYLKKNYVITLQTFQLAILLLFEFSDSLSLSDIAQATLLNEEQLGRHLQSILDSKLLEIQPPSSSSSSQELGPDTVLVLNRGFFSKKSKLKISGAVQKETPQEVAQSHVSIEEDRKIYIQAAIVRIMKSRKVIKHNVLMQEVFSMTTSKFSPSVSLIKKSIETLIERQYLERTPNSTDEYSYIA